MAAQLNLYINAHRSVSYQNLHDFLSDELVSEAHRHWDTNLGLFLTIVIDSAYTKGFEEYAAQSENLYVVDVRLLQANPITFWMLPHSVCLTILIS